MPVNLWNTAISKLYLWATEVTKAYLWAAEVFSSTVPNWLLNNLVSYYKFDNAWSFPDAHGSNNWTVSWVTHVASWKINGSYSFDGVNDYIDIDWINLASSTFTITGWCKTSNPRQFDYIIDTNSPRFIVWFGTQTGGILQIFDWEWRSSELVLWNWSWNFFAVTRTWAAYTMRVNGTTVSWTGQSVTLSWADTKIGTAWSVAANTYYSWELDEIGFWWGKALSATELDVIYNAWAGLSYDNFTT